MFCQLADAPEEEVWVQDDVTIATKKASKTFLIVFFIYWFSITSHNTLSIIGLLPILKAEEVCFKEKLLQD
jgi:hypothetical protein